MVGEIDHRPPCGDVKETPVASPPPKKRFLDRMIPPKWRENAFRLGAILAIAGGAYFGFTESVRAAEEESFGPAPSTWSLPPRENSIFSVGGSDYQILSPNPQGGPIEVLALGASVDEEELVSQDCEPTLTIPDAGVIASCDGAPPTLPGADVYSDRVDQVDPAWTTQQEWLVYSWNDLLSPHNREVPRTNGGPILAESELVISEPQPVSTERVTSSDSLAPPDSLTSAIMGGEYAVQVVFMESDGTVDPSTEDWTEEGKKRIFSSIVGGLNWWTDHAPPNAHLQFIIDPSFIDSVGTGVEPISHPSSFLNIWMGDAMTAFGHDITGIPVINVETEHVNDLRTKFNADWGGLIYVIDSTKDPDHLFEDGMYAFAHGYGPYIVITSTNNPDYPQIPIVVAHELGHTVGAHDAYAGAQMLCKYPGGVLMYLTTNSEYHNSDPECESNVPDVMRADDQFFYLSEMAPSTRWQVGWGDEEPDRIPEAMENGFTAALTATGTLVVGEVRIEPQQLPSSWIAPFTINKINRVEVSINGGSYQPVYALDGKLNSAIERIQFPIPSGYSDPPPIGIEVNDSAGNYGGFGFYPRANTGIDPNVPTEVEAGGTLPITITVSALNPISDTVTGAECRTDADVWQPADPVGGGSGSMYGPVGTFLCQIDTTGLSSGTHIVNARGQVREIDDPYELYYDVVPPAVPVNVVEPTPPTPPPPTPEPTPTLNNFLYLPLIVR